jgi:PIN domain nuclease of toxin-antitoxin system
LTRLLLDTHIVLWLLGDSPRLTSATRDRLGRSGVDCAVSAASWWELSIKESRGIARLGVSVHEIRAAAMAAGLRELPVMPVHAIAVAALPPLHRDPFNRMLIAQAMMEPMILVTADATVLEYAGAVEVLLHDARV